MLEHKKWNSSSEGDFAGKRSADIKADIEKGTVEDREPRKEKTPSDRRKHLPQNIQGTYHESRFAMHDTNAILRGSFRSFLRAPLCSSSRHRRMWERCWVGLQKNDRPADEVFVDPCQDLARGDFSRVPRPPADNVTAAFDLVGVPSENKLMRLLKNGKLCLSRLCG